MTKSFISEKEVLERLADLEHNRWWEWTLQLKATENISKERLDRWDKLWTFYKFLTEEQKEQDRVHARKVIALLKEVGVIPDELK